MQLENDAEGLPAERSERAPVTLLGAAHYWAREAKHADARTHLAEKRAELAEGRARAIRYSRAFWRAAALFFAVPCVTMLVVLWIRS